MEPAAAATAGLYAAEHAVEAGVAAYAVTKSNLPIHARLHHIGLSEPLPRSSHTLSVVKENAYVFGGEIKPREPVSNDIECFPLQSFSKPSTNITHTTIPAEASDGGATPSARVGHSAATARERIFVFGGRGGADMTALPENGRLWMFDTVTKKWDFLDPPPNTDYPQARSYHASTSSPDGTTVIIHAGCASDGTRLSDTWAFYLDQGRWSQLADAPAPGRGGTSITISSTRLYRFGGFDGNTELGGHIDYLDLPAAPTSVPDPDKTTADALQHASPPTEWHSISFALPSDAEKGTPSTLPADRSLAALHPVATGQGRNFLLLSLGEADSSSSGHAGAGKFHADLWAYVLPTASTTAAGVKDAVRARVPGLGSEEGIWSKVEIKGLAVGEEEIEGGKWTGRGWFGSAEDGSGKGFVVFGGVDETNERLGDGWIVKVE
ncbi:MAG: hypothetical protein Q9227_005334 [Pyrenula ochraceoflavens]